MHAGQTNRGSFKKGGRSWNAGITGIKRGPPSKETRDKIRQAKRGPSAYNWKEGSTTEAYRFRRSAPYKMWRTAVYVRDNFTCQECGGRSSPGHRIRFEAHHIKSFAEFPNLRLDVDNGLTLCVSCHKKLHAQNLTGKQATLEGGGTFEEVKAERAMVPA